jgi:hypothetical protein
MESLFFCDLAARQGWPLLTIDEQREVLDQGLEYVTRHSPALLHWAIAKSSAGRLLARSKTSHRPESHDLDKMAQFNACPVLNGTPPSRDGASS